MEYLNDKIYNELIKKLNTDKVLFWKDVTNVCLGNRKIIFIYSSYEVLNMHVKMLTKDGWIYNSHVDKVKITNKLNEDKYEFITGEFRKKIPTE